VNTLKFISYHKIGRMLLKSISLSGKVLKAQNQ